MQSEKKLLEKASPEIRAEIEELREAIAVHAVRGRSGGTIDHDRYRRIMDELRKAATKPEVRNNG